jgi:hypothetical protein
MSTVQQRSVKASFVKGVGVVAGSKNLFIGSSLFSLVRATRFAVMAYSLPGEFSAYSKQKTGNQKPETVPHVPFLFRG